MTEHHCDQDQHHGGTVPACHANQGRPDWLLRICLVLVVVLYGLHFVADALPPYLAPLIQAAHAVHEFMNTIWWGIVIGILMIAALGKIPREFVLSALGTGSGLTGILRATLAGVLLDLCSHGILMVGAKLYERGVSAGQIIAFLVASPWNSFSLTLILIALIGLPWTLAFIGLSMLVALITGVIFDVLVKKSVLPGNPKQFDLPADFRFWSEARTQWSAATLDFGFLREALIDGIKESRMVMRWIFFGVLLAAAIRALLPPELFSTLFGPTLLGLLATISVATVIEVCSEGSSPVAADILTRAGAPGNSFAFLMGGVATDYTEILVLRETTGSLKFALFLPLISLPQILLLAWLINQASVA